MSFGPEHYVPVLKIKGGEKRALDVLAPAVKQATTPLLEIVERSQKKPVTVEEHLGKTFGGLAKAISGYGRYLLDCREIAPDGPAASAEAFQRAANIATPFTPVTGLSRTADVAAALAHRNHGVAIRLTREEFESGRVVRDLSAFLSRHGLVPADVNLIVDLGAVNRMIVPGIRAMTRTFLADVPNHTAWRTLIVSGCAFPASMAVVDRESHAFIERAEWKAWREGLHAARAGVVRVPTFSDCVIQHPSGVEGFDPKIMSVSASIRIALPDQWLLIKGQSTDVVPAPEQFLTLAHRLVYGHLASHFSSIAHCSGCGGAHRAANGGAKYGSAGVWRRLGTIHHITQTVEQIAGLPSP